MSNIEQNRPTEEEQVHEAYAEPGQKGGEEIKEERVEARKEEPGTEGYAEMGKKGGEEVKEGGGEGGEARKESMTEE